MCLKLTSTGFYIHHQDEFVFQANRIGAVVVITLFIIAFFSIQFSIDTNWMRDEVNMKITRIFIIKWIEINGFGCLQQINNKFNNWFVGHIDLLITENWFVTTSNVIYILKQNKKKNI